ncbi:interleukin-1 receptor antagonist protein-like isoform X1 [Strigops habroptila]|uniref:interleukin-1 receptor antagonist protein-like isoform X1 n=1 Tax=Strigops habroptila TaxID=2489341 RepID=UPI0011CF5FDB|nr:interleukin-1 receptor antagonist protein-like isoform X1 [Strigops habroptila]
MCVCPVPGVERPRCVSPPLRAVPSPRRGGTQRFPLRQRCGNSSAALLLLPSSSHGGRSRRPRPRARPAERGVPVPVSGAAGAAPRGAGRRGHRCPRCPRRICDVDHKRLYLRDGRLVAGHLQGANAAREEKVFWVPNRAFAPARLPVIMGIQNGSRCLASAPGPRPSLCLQDADIRELPRAGPASAAFTFFRSYRAGLWRFESAANPGWFLCTSARGHQPLGLSRSHDATTRLDFYFSAAESPEPGTAPGDGDTPTGDRDPPTGERDPPIGGGDTPR